MQNIRNIDSNESTISIDCVTGNIRYVFTALSSGFIPSVISRWVEAGTSKNQEQPYLFGEIAYGEELTRNEHSVRNAFLKRIHEFKHLVIYPAFSSKYCRNIATFFLGASDDCRCGQDVIISKYCKEKEKSTRIGHILGIYDASIMKSGKEGVLFTTAGLVHRADSSTPPQYIFFHEFKPEDIQLKKTLFSKAIFLGQDIKLPLISFETEEIAAIAKFITEACKYHQRPDSASIAANHSLTFSLEDPMQNRMNPAGREKDNSNQGDTVAEKKLIFEEILAPYTDQLKSDKIYFAPDIPRRKAVNAIKSYAGGLSPHDILILIDNSVFGGAKSGMLITANKVYFHDFGSVRKCFKLSAIKKLKYHGTRIRISEKFTSNSSETMDLCVAGITKDTAPILIALIQKMAKAAGSQWY